MSSLHRRNSAGGSLLGGYCRELLFLVMDLG